MRALRFILLPAWIAAQAFVSAAEVDPQLTAVREEIVRLEVELGRLKTREGSVLARLERLSAELTLASSRLREVQLRRDAIQTGVGEREELLVALGRAQEERIGYLAFRLRELYKSGSSQALRRLLGDSDRSAYWEGLRYAAFLNERDHAVLADFRSDKRRLADERDLLRGENLTLQATERELLQTQRQVRSGRRNQARYLADIRDDATRREAALGELRDAAASLTARIERAVATAEPTLDMRKFRGLLDWPASGPVRSGFGSKIHPRFKTRVPHPGLDIDAPAGSPIRAVFDGEVVFSGWMRGYGLTAIVDHGNGLHSVYAHAAVLWVEPGERLPRGQRLGIVGETGSFSGLSLYFELRLDGQAVDPIDWLRKR